MRKSQSNKEKLGKALCRGGFLLCTTIKNTSIVEGGLPDFVGTHSKHCILQGWIPGASSETSLTETLYICMLRLKIPSFYCILCTF